jgi:hypothetical protein
MRQSVMAAALGVLMACGQAAEVRIDDSKGIPPVKGSTEVSLASFTCNMPITSGSITVQTKTVAEGCELSFDQDVPVLKAEDYTNIPDLKAATALVQRIELTVKKLTFTDGTTSMPLDLATRVVSAQLLVNGQLVAEKKTLSSLPTVVTLSGSALDQIKSKIDARQPASVRTRVVLVLPTMPAPPQKLVIDYDSQPAIILGATAPKLF